MDTLTTVDLAPPVARDFVVAPTYRILRVSSARLLAEYRREWPAAVRDFHRRSGPRIDGRPTPMPATSPEAMQARLEALPDTAHGALWLALTPTYRLLGFLAATLSPALWGPVTAEVHAYLWPRRPAWAVLPALLDTAGGWARAHGATALAFGTFRDRPRALGRLGFVPAQRVWVKTLTEGEGAD